MQIMMFIKRSLYISFLLNMIFIVVLFSGCTSDQSGLGDYSTDSNGSPCLIGSEGCSCTSGGACDSGLVCLSLVCVYPANDGTETDTGIVDTDTGTSDTDIDTNTDTGIVDTDTGTSDTETGTADTDTGTSDTDTGTSDTDTGTSDTDTGTSDTDTGTSDTDTGTSDTDTGTSDTDTGTSDTDTVDTDTWPEPPGDRRIEAECAFGFGTGDCIGPDAVDGSNSNESGSPRLENDDTTVGYIDSGTWLAYPEIDFTGYTHLRIRMAANSSGGILIFRLNGVSGPTLGSLTVSATGGWDSWQEVIVEIDPSEGVNTLYVVGAGTSTGIGNLDWLELYHEPPPVYLNPRASVNERVDDLISRMTLAEKIGQMTQASVGSASTTNTTTYGLGSVLAGGNDGPYPYDASNWIAHTTLYQQAAQNTRLGIPLLYGIDAVHGHAKMRGATIIPHNIGLGATRNPSLVRELGRITAVEMAATGCHWTFAPAISVARDERWGRTYESFGEHPQIASSMATFIEGLQGTNLSYPSGVLACAKHYVGDGGALWGTSDVGDIDQGDAVMSEAALRAIHLEPYFPAVAAGVGTVMPSYSSFNGVKMHEHVYLLRDVLRGEMGFEGFIISDWNAIDQLSGANFGERIVRALNAGVDMFMEPTRYATFISTLTGLVGTIVSEDRIDESVRRILTVKFRMGLFERPFADESLVSQIYSSSHRALAREAVRESLVLLKNENNFLPLQNSDTVCITGSGANSVTNQSGGWTLGWNEPRLVTPQGETISGALSSYLSDKSGSVVTSGCRVGIRVVSESEPTYAEYFGDDANPSHDNSGSCTATDGCVVVILGGRPVNIEGLLADSNTKAVVMAWYPGSEGGGIIDVLYAHEGVNFTGVLPMTWKRDHINTPWNFCTAGSAQCDDAGGHYSNISSPPAEVLFPYGYGQHYE